MSTFTPARPYLKALTDGHGRTWQFGYWGSGFIYIREVIDGNEGVPRERHSRDVWPYLIDLNSYGMRPADVTRPWLVARITEWVADRNNEDREDTP